MVTGVYHIRSQFLTRWERISRDSGRKRGGEGKRVISGVRAAKNPMNRWGGWIREEGRKEAGGARIVRGWQKGVATDERCALAATDFLGSADQGETTAIS